MNNKAAGEALPPSKPLTGPAPPWSSVCAPGTMSLHCIADPPGKGELTMSFTSWLRTLRSFGHLGTTARKSRQAARFRPAKRFQPKLESFEDRCLLSTFTVLSLLDSGPDSLRAAVAAANANPGVDAIDFATTGTI